MIRILLVGTYLIIFFMYMMWERNTEELSILVFTLDEQNDTKDSVTSAAAIAHGYKKYLPRPEHATKRDEQEESRIALRTHTVKIKQVSTVRKTTSLLRVPL